MRSGRPIHETAAKCGVALRRCGPVWAFCVASMCCAQSTPGPAIAKPSPLPHSSHLSSAGTEQPGATAAKSPGTAASSADAAPRPPQITLTNGELRVEADNSDLAEILHRVAAMSGMTIDGLNKGARIFGVYGPGNPREIITDLLADSGYDFMMIGSAKDGAPRELLLTAHNNDGPAAVPANPNPAPSTNSEESQGAASEMPVPEPPGPGAIYPPPPPETPDEQDRVQQNAQRLQHIHDQQQQQHEQ